MGYFQVRYDSRVVIYDRRGFIILATGLVVMGGASKVVGPNPGTLLWMDIFRIYLLQKL